MSCVLAESHRFEPQIAARDRGTLRHNLPVERHGDLRGCAHLQPQDRDAPPGIHVHARQCAGTCAAGGGSRRVHLVLPGVLRGRSHLSGVRAVSHSRAGDLWQSVAAAGRRIRKPCRDLHAAPQIQGYSRKRDASSALIRGKRRRARRREQAVPLHRERHMEQAACVHKVGRGNWFAEACVRHCFRHSAPSVHGIFGQFSIWRDDGGAGLPVPCHADRVLPRGDSGGYAAGLRVSGDPSLHGAV